MRMSNSISGASSADVDLASWPHLFAPGEGEGELFVTLHGTAGNESEIAALATALAPDAAVLSPRGRVTERGMNRWFRRLGEGNFDVDDVIARAAELAGFVAAAQSAYGLEGRRITAVGFSNGANIALAVAQLHPGVFQRVLAFSGMYPFGDRVLEADLNGTEIILLSGDSDPMAPLERVRVAVSELTRKGASVELALRPGGHRLAPGDLESARSWLASHSAL
jgi:phospholipase/carboxylesterase